jgi:hypothetical protein
MSRRRIEDGIQRAIFEHLCWRGSAVTFAFHCPDGGARTGIEGAILKGLGVVAGVPDIMVIYNGHTYVLELKAAGGQLSSSQQHVHERLRAAGAEVAVVAGLNAALRQLETWKLLRVPASAGKVPDHSGHPRQ